jgi:hypothetical protein|tara:strand:- start:6740 stop:7075 length:336 start_codon:yes stop_codon:yes gene_type:complete
MTIDVLREVTQWDEPSLTANNGIYWVNRAGHLVAFQSPNSDNRTVFKNPLKGFSKSRRKFEKIGSLDESLPADTITVQGSNGETYTITDGVCSCPGFKFRGKCKHTAQLEA